MADQVFLLRFSIRLYSIFRQNSSSCIKKDKIKVTDDLGYLRQFDL